MMAATCSVANCNKSVLARGWCTAHYHRWLKHGDVQADIPIRTKVPLIDLLMRRIDKNGADGCWVWTGSITKWGYGAYRPARALGLSDVAHRTVYQVLVGPIPEGLVLDHLCRNKRCVNPDHLEPVTDRVNQLRAPNSVLSRALGNAAKTHCKHGHEFTLENTYEHGGSRYCRACNRDAQRRQAQRKQG